MTVLFKMCWNTAKETYRVSKIRWVSLHVLTSDLRLSVIAIAESTSCKPVATTYGIFVYHKQAILFRCVIILGSISSTSVISLA